MDGTLGSGGHAAALLEKIGESGRLIGLDQDPASLERCRERFEGDSRVSLHHKNFAALDEVLDSLNVSKVDAVILDVGFSSDQLEDGGRGFSFERPGPLDMRMNPDSTVNAADLVNGLSEKELETMFFNLGNERWGRRFAKAICERRYSRPIETTEDLVQTLEDALPFKSSKSKPIYTKRHFATRVFQALRIAVNRELEVLESALPVAWNRLRSGGRLGVITFHSLEDRIVKNRFRQWKQSKEGVLVTRKALSATREETLENPRSRSAKLRVVRKIA